jgi:glyoxylase-like metal-dependent hydrolase (beta-lactamase superfamily II)
MVEMAVEGDGMAASTHYVSTRHIGAASVTAINEGTVSWAPELTAPEEEWRLAMPEVDEEGRIPADHHAVHIRLGNASVLVDAGLDDPSSAWSQRWLAEWPGARRTPGLQAGLTSIGVRPEEITHVVVTHAHYDHVVGLTVEREGRQVPRYANARVLLGRGDWEGNPERDDPASEVAMRLRVIEQSGLLELVDRVREVVPGLWMLHAPGESPGHSVVRLTSGDACFYALGDLFHHACEVEHPDWSVPWADKETMRASRERLLREAVRTHATVVFAHEPFPPWGRIVRVGGGYRWQRG